MHAVIDSDRRLRNDKEESVLRNRFHTAESARNEARHQHLVGQITDPEKQMGGRLTTLEFGRRLRKLNKDLSIRPHPNRQNPDYPQIQNTALLYLTIGDHEEYLMPFELDWMPEWSVMDVTVIQKPYVGDGGYWPEQKIPGREVRRGWRTVLLRLVEKKIISLNAAEREFGPGNRPSWARLRQNVVAPI